MEKYEGYMFSALCSSNLLVSCLLFSAVTREQREPYMDEIFHVPQAQRYCDGRFSEWDPMITTLPGLYLASVGVIRPVVWLADLTGAVVCSTAMLRFVNLLFNAGNLYLLYLLLCRLHPHEKSAAARRVLSALALSTFPVLYFFNFLYYTDAGSTFFILFTYLMTSYGCHKAAALLAGCAVLFRQTNVVWVAFCAGTLLAARMDDAWRAEHRAKKKDDDDRSPDSPPPSGPSSQVPLSVGGARRVLRFAFGFLASPARVGAFLCAEAWPYAVVGAAFAAFMLLNGGIVVGDRQKHEASFNAPQLLYFLSFALFFSLPATLCYRRALRFLRALRTRPLLFLSLGALLLVLVWRFTYEHEYLLADNRHYTFYVWGRVFRRHALARYALVPAYVYAAWHFLDVLGSSRRYSSLFWILAFLTCVAAATVPQKLLEFRYFIVPYLMYRLHMPLPTMPRILLEMALYTAVNAATLYVFLNKTFHWPDDSAAQRFMW